MVPVPVLTRSYDNCRSGANLHETVLTVAGVVQNGVRVLARLTMDGDNRGSEGQPLVLPAIVMADGLTHNVILLATMANDVYCFDFDNYELLWAKRVANPITNTRAMDMYLINDHWGILSTPVIDPATQLIYVVTMSSPNAAFGNSTHHLHVLDITNGTAVAKPLDLSTAAYTATGLPTQTLGKVPRKQRCALALDTRNALTTLYIGYGSFLESASTNQGWLVAVDITTPTAPVLACAVTTTSRYSGGGLWMGSQGPTIDPNTGNIGVVVGNGGFDGVTDFGESVLWYTYVPKSGAAAARFDLVANFTPYTDMGRVYGQAHQMLPDPSALPKTTAQLAPMAMPTNLQHVVIDNADAALVATSNMNNAADEDLNSGGKLFISKAMSGFATDYTIVCGKDGIGYVLNADQYPSTQLKDFDAAVIAQRVYAVPTWIGWLTYYNPTSPTPVDLAAIPTTYQGFTHHLHGTCAFYRSAKHGPLVYCWGENGNLRAWSLTADGQLHYLASSADVASPNCTTPPGGMPGGLITVSANGRTAGSALIHCCVPWGDANKTITPGHFMIFDAENFATFADGSGAITKLWDSADWGIAYSHCKFNQATVSGGKILLPTYDGAVIVLG
jgi:hypothetical protein